MNIDCIPIISNNEDIIFMVNEASTEFDPGITNSEVPQAKIYKRLMSEATSSKRFGKSYEGGGKAEFDALKKLYSVDPIHVVKPISLMTDSTGEVIGYNMEYVTGITALEYKKRYNVIPKDITDQIRGAVKIFHNNGLSHGDLNPENIFITPEGTVKIIDPVSYGNIPSEEFEKYKDLDLNELKAWI